MVTTLSLKSEGVYSNYFFIVYCQEGYEQLLINHPLFLISNMDAICSHQWTEILREVTYKSTILELVDCVNCHFSKNRQLK